MKLLLIKNNNFNTFISRMYWKVSENSGNYKDFLFFHHLQTKVYIGLLISAIIRN